jgi:hypothetical protein
MHHTLNKLLCRYLCHAEVKPADQHHLDPGTCKQFQLFAQAGQSGRCLVRGKELLRLRLERHHRGRQVTLARDLYEASEHGPVAKVKAVKVANGQRHWLIGPLRRPPQHAHMV